MYQAIIFAFYPQTMVDKSPLNFEDTSVAFASKSNTDLFKTKFLFTTMKYHWMVSLGTKLTTIALDLSLPIKGLIKSTLFNQFCGGESVEDCQRTITNLGDFNVQTILDYSVEGQENELSFDETLNEALNVVRFAAEQPKIPFCVIKLTGLGSATLMEKAQSGQRLTEEETGQYQKFEQRVHQLADAVSKNNLRFMIDAEESWIQEEIDRIAYDLMKEFNKERAVIYNTYQLYRHDVLIKMQKAFDRLGSSGLHFGAKLVRGAYMEKERERASRMGYQDPIQVSKEATDTAYNKAIDFALDHLDSFSVCAGTHNEYSCAYLASSMEIREISKDDPRVYFAQLLGMSDNISFKLSDDGYNVAKYVPYGPVKKVLPYLFRRADENTSIAGQSGRELNLVSEEIRRRKSAK